MHGPPTEDSIWQSGLKLKRASGEQGESLVPDMYILALTITINYLEKISLGLKKKATSRAAFSFESEPWTAFLSIACVGGLMETIVERPGALDVHKAQVTACVRTPTSGGGRDAHFAEFPTTVAGLLTLRDWLAAHRVTQVTMEATGVYWKPVWAILEDDFELLLVNARHVKQVPGRKTDISDAAWLCQLAEAGLLRASFVPPKPIRTLRNLTRYRKTQIQERAREANRLHKALEDTGIKLDCVATDILGVSGRLMLDALVAGTTAPQVLADLARGRLRAKIPALREALEGRFDRMHALWVGAILAHIDFLDEQIAALTEAIGEQIAPFEKAVELLCTITGVQRRTAETIIAEIGIDMSIFPSAKELASWAGQCPGNHQSAGKRRSGRTRKGSKWLNDALKVSMTLAVTRAG